MDRDSRGEVAQHAKCVSSGRKPRSPAVRKRRGLVLLSLDWLRDKDSRISPGHASLLASLRRVLDSERGTPIQGVAWRADFDRASPAAVEFAQLPSPILTGVVPVGSFMRWETQRRCPYTCSFCQHREPGARLRRRMLAPVRVAAEVDALVRGGARDIAILDPIFNVNPDAVGILRRFAGLRARGQSFEVSLIYGLPNQTLASFQQTVRWCQDRGVPVIRAFPLMLLCGTRLARERDRWGLVENDEPVPVVVESHSFSRRHWEQMRDLADRLDGDQRQGGVA